MTEISLPLLIFGLVFAAAVSILALILWARMSPDPDQAVHAMLGRASGRTVFLFDGRDLVDCTPPARMILDELAPGTTDLDRLLRSLSARFHDLPDVDTLLETATETRYDASDPSTDIALKFESWDGYLRVELTDLPDEEEVLETFALGRSDELAALRNAADHAPFLMWQTDETGRVEWANEAYLVELRRSGAPDPNHWPPAPIFESDLDTKLGSDKLTQVARSVSGTMSFDVSGIAREGKRHYFAVSAEETMKAEAAQRNFVQTLTKTFAQLSIGLAIFDQDRELVLFNPALTDLLPLPVEFLSQKPSLPTFLDRLREERMIAEPKNYKVWRRHIIELEAQAVDGSYCEAWSLPGGITFRVTGRPHPDGAIAFLFEDISAETSLTQRFHAEIELGHAALDAVEEAIALVNGGGVLTFTNKAYGKLWGSQPDESLMSIRLDEAVEEWREDAAPSPMWDTLKSEVARRGKLASWSGEAPLKDGRMLTCRTQRLSGGATLVGFKVSAPLTSALSQLAARRKSASNAAEPLTKPLPPRATAAS